MVHRNIFRLHALGRFRVRTETLDRRALLQASLAVIAGALLQAAPSPVLAQAAPEFKGFEQALGNAIGRWTGRITAVGVAANDNAVRQAVSDEIAAAAVSRGVARGAPFLRVIAPYLGPIGRVVGLASNAFLIADALGAFARVVKQSDGVAGDADGLIDQLGENGYRVGPDGSTWFVSAEPYGYSLTKYSGKGFDFFYQRNSPEPRTGFKFVLWRRPSSAGSGVPAPEPDAPVEALSPGDRAREVLPDDLAKILNEILRNARLRNPGAVPDPVAYPVTPNDFLPETPSSPRPAPVTVGHLGEATSLDRPPQVAPPPAGGGTGDGGGSSGGGSGDFPPWPVAPWDEPGRDFGLPAFQFPSLSMPSGGECPKLTGTWKGNEITMDPCPIATTARPMVSSLSTFLYWFAALRVMFASK